MCEWQIKDEFRQRGLAHSGAIAEQRHGPRVGLDLLGHFHRLQRQEIPRRDREHGVEQVFRAAGDQDPDPEGRRKGECAGEGGG